MSQEQNEQVQPCFAIDPDLRQDLEEAFKSADTNGDHTIDRKEFIAAMTATLRRRSQSTFSTLSIRAATGKSRWMSSTSSCSPAAR